MGLMPPGRDERRRKAPPGPGRAGHRPPAPGMRRRKRSRGSWVRFAGFMAIGLAAVLGSGWFFTGGGSAARAAESRAPAVGPARAGGSGAAGPSGSPAAPNGGNQNRESSPTTMVTLAAGTCAANLPGEKDLVVSIIRQTLWACDGTEMVNTSPVTTGADDATPLGTFHIQAKEGPQYLNGCNYTGCWHDYVHVWMPFDGSYGFHDAPWQTMPFGAGGYMTEGSHGCVHLPSLESQWVFDWATVGTTVTIET